MARYRVELSDKILESEEEYQNAVDRLADVKRHQSQFLLQEATVRIFAVTNGTNSVFIPVVSTSTRSEIVIKIEEKNMLGLSNTGLSLQRPGFTFHLGPRVSVISLLIDVM